MEAAHLSESSDALPLQNRGAIEQPVVTAASAVEALPSCHKPTIDELVNRFLENTKFRFGDHSIEVHEIHGILNTFRTGKASKRDALSSIQVTLGSHEDLKQDLMNVLHHEDARWGDGDFDLHGLSQQPLPPFLQPAHEPQMRLPSISSTWHSDHQHLQAINPAILRNYHISNNYGDRNFRELNDLQYGGSWSSLPGMPSSPMTYAHTSFPGQNQLTTPPVGIWSTVSHQPTASHDAVMSLPPQQFSNHMQQTRLHDPFERNDYNDLWAAADSLPKLVELPPSNYQHSPMPSYGTPSPRFTSPKKGSLLQISPSVLGNPYALPIGQPAIDMPPPKKRTRKESPAQVKNDEQSGEQDAENPSLVPLSPTIQAQRSSSYQAMSTKTNTKAARVQSEGGSFIHGICGKSFTTRSKVKQHHWGKKMDDLQTTTGCWVKHNKPNVNWDDHPSCKDSGPAPHTAQKKHPRPTIKTTDSDHKAPMVPGMLASRNTIPGFPTLHDLPQTVVETLSPSIPSQPTLHDAGPSRPSSRGSHENLLTVSNLASRTDAPKLQARNDSVAFYLDAQGTESERNVQLLPIWTDPSRGHLGDGFVEVQSPTTANRPIYENFGDEKQIRSTMVSPPQLEDNLSTPSVACQSVEQRTGLEVDPTKRQTSLADAEVEREQA